MRVAVTGATGVLGRSAVQALRGAGHDVLAIARDEAGAVRAREQTLEVAVAPLDDRDALRGALQGCDAVANLATRVPVGYSAAFGRSWRQHDRLRSRGAGALARAAREAGVRLLVQESVSHLYADAGDAWVTESHPLGITLSTEPASMAEAAVGEFRSDSHTGIVLRFGLVIGDDSRTRRTLRACSHGRAVGIGDPDGWAHVVHTDDVGGAVLAALSAPGGTYNVGAMPVRRHELVEGFARAVGTPAAGFVGPLGRRIAGPRHEPLSRSLRVSSDRFVAATGWTPSRSRFDVTWFDAALATSAGHAHA